MSTNPSLCCLGLNDQAVVDHYNTRPGTTATLPGGPITAAVLTGLNLFVILSPEMAFTAGEAAALSGFLSTGGSLFLLGDNSAFPAENANINNLLAGLGSGMQIIPATLDAG